MTTVEYKSKAIMTDDKKESIYRYSTVYQWNGLYSTVWMIQLLYAI